MDFVGETFRRCEVDIDGNSFTECRFEDVTLNYGGGQMRLIGCVFDGVQIRLTGDLANGLDALRQLHHDWGPKMVKKLVDDISAMLRRKDPPQTIVIH